ncbi:MAG TPA: ABC transporter permease [Ignavibacteriales bacterium]|nr:ABC transporter permease [Ignavibacteriales bacterium]
MKTIKALAIKEFYHLSRDKKMVLLLLFFPIFLLIFFGYAVNFDVKNIKIQIINYDRSEFSNEIIKALENSDYFTIVDYQTKNSYQELGNGKCNVIFIIPHDFSKNLAKKNNTQITAIIGAANANNAIIISNYLNYFITKINYKLLEKYNITIPNTVNINYKYNKSLETTTFLMPGLLAMIIIVTAVISVSLSFVKEKEQGTIEQIIISPIKDFQYIIAKIIPYSIICIIDTIFLLITMYLIFQIKVQGSIIELFIVTIIYIISGLCFGLFISSVSNSQQVAFLIAALSSLLPTFLLSGFVFNIESMPKFIQIFTNITPAKFYISIIRNIMIRGANFTFYFLDLIYLILFTIVILLLTLKMLKLEKNKLFDV